MKMRGAKKILALCISLALLTILIASVDGERLLRVLSEIRLGWFIAGVLFFIPQILAIARRWRLIAHPVAPISSREAGRQIVASNCLNLVLPSKLGDLAKGVFLFRQGHCRLQDGMHVVVFEKLLDLGALSAWMIAGWLLAPRFDWWVLGVLALGIAIIAMVTAIYFSDFGTRVLLSLIPQSGGKIVLRLREIVSSAPRVMRLINASRKRQRAIVAWSFGIWLLHLLQIFCFFTALESGVSLFQVLSLMPIAIFAGLMPLTVAGIGVRDWAIVAIFSSLGAAPAILVGVGLLVSLRYVIPALIGLPFVSRYFLLSRSAQVTR